MADLDDIKDGKDFHTDAPQRNTPFTLKGCGALDWGCSPDCRAFLILRLEERSCSRLTTAIFRGRQRDWSVSILISPPVPARRCADVYTRYSAQRGAACH